MTKVMAKESELVQTFGSPNSHFFIYPYKQFRVLKVHSSLFLIRAFPEEIILKKIENASVIYFLQKEHT